MTHRHVFFPPSIRHSPRLLQYPGVHELQRRPDLAASEINGSEKPGRQLHENVPARLMHSASELQSFRSGEPHSFKSIYKRKIIRYHKCIKTIIKRE